MTSFLQHFRERYIATVFPVGTNRILLKERILLKIMVLLKNVNCFVNVALKNTQYIQIIRLCKNDEIKPRQENSEDKYLQQITKHEELPTGLDNERNACFGSFCKQCKGTFDFSLLASPTFILYAISSFCVLGKYWFSYNTSNTHVHLQFCFE